MNLTEKLIFEGNDEIEFLTAAIRNLPENTFLIDSYPGQYLREETTNKVKVKFEKNKKGKKFVTISPGAKTFFEEVNLPEGASNIRIYPISPSLTDGAEIYFSFKDINYRIGPIN